MIRIAICDDLKILREELKEQLLIYGKKRNLEYCIYEYENGTKMLEDNKEYDLAFLDYQYENDKSNNGITIATKLREVQKNVTIIFLSSYPAVVFDSFTVGTFRFLVKPIQVNKFQKAMDDFLKTLDQENILSIKVEGVNRSLHTKEISYIEGFGKYCIIHMLSEREKEIECHETLAVIEERLPKDIFYRCHKSYVVNLSHIDSYNRTSIFILSGEEVFISRTKYKEFTEIYMNYLSRYL